MYSDLSSSLRLQKHFEVAFCHIYSTEQVSYPLVFDFFSNLAVAFPLNSNVLPLSAKGQDVTDAVPEECVLGLFFQLWTWAE